MIAPKMIDKGSDGMNNKIISLILIVVLLLSFGCTEKKEVMSIQSDGEDGIGKEMRCKILQGGMEQVK